MDDADLRPLLPGRLRRGELIALDCVAGVGYTAVLLIGALTPQSSTVPAVAALVIAGIGLPLTVRRLWPLTAFAVAFASTLLATALDLVREPFIAASFALYLVAVTVPRRRWEPTLAIGVVSLVGIVVLVSAGPGPGADTPVLAAVGGMVMGGTWTVGRAVRERRAFAERHARQLADRAAAEERLRIARELHDVVSHTLSLIGVKAGIANHVADTRPDEVRDALRVIETTSREALVEMRHMLGVLRSDRTAEAGPLPGLAGLAELAERAALAGVRIDLDVRGVDRLPLAVELSVYRIAQEAVTNVLKHAGPAHCQVVVAATANGVRIDVTDDGPGCRPVAAPGSGQGLIGMRERALIHGGTFAAGPRLDGGFGISAYLPVDAPGAAEEVR